MSKEIICVYQDCVMCSDRGKKLTAIALKHGADIRRVSFASEEGRSLVHTALFEHNIGYLPFFTDGVKFSRTLSGLFEEKSAEAVEKSPEKPAKKKHTRKRKGGKA